VLGGEATNTRFMIFDFIDPIGARTHHISHLRRARWPLHHQRGLTHIEQIENTLYICSFALRFPVKNGIVSWCLDTNVPSLEHVKDIRHAYYRFINVIMPLLPSMILYFLQYHFLFVTRREIHTSIFKLENNSNRKSISIKPKQVTCMTWLFNWIYIYWVIVLCMSRMHCLCPKIN
jgi:hypothetical protein